MRRDAFDREIAEIVARQLDVPKARLAGDRRLVEDLGADSLALAQLALALEEHFGIDLPDEPFRGVSTVAELSAYVRRIR